MKTTLNGVEVPTILSVDLAALGAPAAVLAISIPEDSSMVSIDFGLGLTSLPGGGAPTLETLAIPGDPFPVTLQRDASGYSVAETGADFLAAYTGATWHVSPAGNDTTGDGSSGAPFATIGKAVTEASALDRIQLAAGVHPTPPAIGKSVALLGPESGHACIGAFFDLTGVSITENTGPATNAETVSLWVVPDPATGQTVRGFLRLDGARPSGYIGNGGVGHSLDGGSLVFGRDRQQRGVPVVYTGGSSAVLGSGTAATIPALVAAGDILAWTDGATAGVAVSGTAELYIGAGVVVANYAAAAVSAGTSGSLILDRCEVYGGSGSTVSADTSGRCLSFGAVIAGAGEDCIDYRSACIGVEVDCLVGWPTARLASNNASTGHEDAKILRVGGTYEGGARTIHDINDVASYTFSCTIRDAVDGDQTLYRIGLSTGPDATAGWYGDVTFAGTYSNDVVVDAGASATEIGLAGAWPW